MPLFAPDYYPDFCCIAGDCLHSCCIGWEIDIDPHTLSRYQALPSAQRRAILSHTVTQNGCTSFRLTQEERCPFLTTDGLCRLILTHGEGILCDICREHPRFYNVFSGRTEAGLGLCCEAAARLILTHSAPFHLICLDKDTPTATPEDPFEREFFATRKRIFQTLCDRSHPLSERIDKLLEEFSLSGEAIYESDPHWQAVYRSLERLDPQWDAALNAWADAFWQEQTASPSAPVDAVAVEQLIVYFLYRHLSDAPHDGRLQERIAFALLSAHAITSIAVAINPSASLDTLIDTARAYSAEVEYDEDNVEIILGELTKILFPIS